jgi:hypothetical protein
MHAASPPAVFGAGQDSYNVVRYGESRTVPHGSSQRVAGEGVTSSRWRCQPRLTGAPSPPEPKRVFRQYPS